MHSSGENNLFFLPLLRILLQLLMVLGLIVNLFTCSSSADMQLTKSSNSLVILLHGLARTNQSMRPIQKALNKGGYSTCNIDYPSTKKTIQDLITQDIYPSITHCKTENFRKIHFVTHSMGGILVRYLLQHQGFVNLGRVVMLSPPNQGSEVVDSLGDLSLFEWINGPAGKQMGTGEDSIPLKLGPVDFELGVITGDRSINPILSMLIPGEDDGKVSTTRAQVEGMTDFLIVPHSHTFIMQSEFVIKQTLHFIQHGKFLPTI